MDALREIVLPRLDVVRKSGGGFSARCPAHDDHRSSLSVSPGRDQPVVFHCHAGCEPDVILDKLGLAWTDLTTPREQPASGEWTPAGPAVAVYDYRDERGTLLFQVCRTADKQFLQRTPDPAGKTGWRWKLGDTRRVLYRLPEILTAVAERRTVYVCEGEKDVHTLEALGQEATCNPGGAGKWRNEYAEVLRDTDVIVVADKDSPGQAHARTVRDTLLGLAASVCIVEAADGCKDITDHIRAGHGLHEVALTWADNTPEAVDLAPDLWQFLATADAPYDWLIPNLLERGDRLMLTGFEGLGKSMLVRQFAVAMAAGIHPFDLDYIEPHRVLVIDCENSERQSRRIYRRLATATEMYGRPPAEGYLRLIHKPAGIDLTRDADAAWLLERVTAHQPDVLFIGPFYRLHNANLNEELPARKTVAALDQARTAVDCSLVIEAHAGHGEQGLKRSVRPTGSSLLLRWPEFGYGLAPGDEPRPGEPTRLVEVRPWRGPRDERAWPTHLGWGDRDGFPWVRA